MRLCHQGDSIRAIRDYFNGIGISISYHGVNKVIKNFEEDACSFFNNSTIEEKLLLHITENLKLSVRELEKMLGIPKPEIRNIKDYTCIILILGGFYSYGDIKKNSFKSYESSRVQDITESDKLLGTVFWKKLMDIINR